jgi:hypothetical protein
MNNIGKKKEKKVNLQIPIEGRGGGRNKEEKRRGTQRCI